MVIETEYNIGDEVYTLYKNKVFMEKDLFKTKEELLKSL
jgi:hypothetical protein